jgi:hypothetical protein
MPYVRAANDDESYDLDLVALLKKFLSSPIKSSEQINDECPGFIQLVRQMSGHILFTCGLRTSNPLSIALLAMVAYGFPRIL